MCYSRNIAVNIILYKLQFYIYRKYITQLLVLYVGVSTAIGCPEVTAPSGGWVRTLDGERGNNAVGGHQDSVMMRCNDSQETWYLTCTSNHWLGQQANCTHGNELTSSEGRVSTL